MLISFVIDILAHFKTFPDRYFWQVQLSVVKKLQGDNKCMKLFICDDGSCGRKINTEYNEKKNKKFRIQETLKSLDKCRNKHRYQEKY